MRKSGILLAAALLGACAGNKENIDITKPVTGAEASNAEKAYRRGLDEKSHSSFIEATRYFEWVRNNFPYSQYSALSELALADMAYERDDHATAAAAYADFVKIHPSHPKADYASFRVGLANYGDRPSEWFLLPPAYEKDQAPLRAAQDAFEKFLRLFPKSEYVPQARQLLAECRERLAAHERYVAQFYMKRERWKGAAGRYLGLADVYGDLDGGKVRGEALWNAGEALRREGDVTAERHVLERLVSEAPQDPHRGEAETRLKTMPAPKPAPVEPGAHPEGAAHPDGAAQPPEGEKKPDADRKPGEPVPEGPVAPAGDQASPGGGTPSQPPRP